MWPKRVVVKKKKKNNNFTKTNKNLKDCCLPGFWRKTKVSHTSYECIHIGPIFVFVTEKEEQ